MKRQLGISTSIFLCAVSISPLVYAQTAEPAPSAPPPGAAPPSPAEPPPAATEPPPAASSPASPTPEPPPASSVVSPFPAAPPVHSDTIVGPVASPFKIENPMGSIKFGLLLQPQFEATGSPTQNDVSENLYLRRARILVGGSLFKTFDFFVETDSPNLFKAANVPAGGTNLEGVNAAQKPAPTMVIQDAFASYKAVQDFFKIDAGYMLPPLAHNAVQGAGTLYSYDYFANTFNGQNYTGVAAAPAGRDLGVQLRGLLFDNHLEYRVGMFQGLRNAATPAAMGNQVNSRNFFRLSGRLQINLLDAETGFFYAGTYHGAKKILSVGGSYDFQESYRYWAADAFLDMPAGPGVVTAQVNVAHWDGGTFIPQLVEQTAFMGEAGYLFPVVPISPILRFERLLVAAGLPTDTNRYGGGLAFWPYGHTSNLKIFYNRIAPANAVHNYDDFDVQWQLYFY
jgi:hypothetical protein